MYAITVIFARTATPVETRIFSKEEVRAVVAELRLAYPRGAGYRVEVCHYAD